MIIMVHAEVKEADVERRLGTPRYSYFFAMKEFLPVLERLGILVRLEGPTTEIDGVFEFCREIGHPSVFLSFAPPHMTPIDLQCPTIPVFPVEFNDLPADPRDSDRQNDWSWVLRRLGRAITHSSHACEVVRRSVGASFPVAAIPSPVWDRFARLRRDAGPIRKLTLRVAGVVADSQAFQPRRRSTPATLSARTLFTYNPRHSVSMPSQRPTPTVADLEVSGVIYTTIFNPRDGRKNWLDILRAFCTALRDQADATLLVKIIHRGDRDIRYVFLRELGKLSPFDCRVVMIDAFLDKVDYAALIGNSTYTVNASLGEGQCLPLMESMSAGVPGIAPRHSAMLDYVNESNAFIVGSTLEPCAWPHDLRQKIRTTRHRIDAQSLADAFSASYAVAKQHPEHYQAMSQHASEMLKRHCSRAVVEARLQSFLADCAPETRRPAVHVAAAAQIALVREVSP